ncbi:cellulase family glycosylhydrolase [Hyphobacterium sp. HN65]|uniref:Cellulase family glycosylhydrolase n=1 Tax=Hyphobacterium lacteum TaxID=3116575 RepID=A0ABU7LMD4_9PROT|nr:cellulase family glycosylhydrolase [Hyphobacterium sp. HN65]MEE2525098.1 cellulase family glycosylhydrolase [Hyphobacterium sp. HN65]
MVTGPSRRHVLIAGSAAFGLGSATRQTRSKIDLWDNASGPHLRGVVFPQRRVYPEIDGDTFLGPGPVGAPITNRSLDELAAAGANLALLSYPGIFTERAPYQPDPAIEDHLAELVERCVQRGIFVVIGFRSGPGRSEFTFHRDSAGDWFPASMINERVWQDPLAQDAWCSMWRYVAQQFSGHRGIAGYLPMVEPNASHVVTHFNWPRFAMRMANAIREADAETPVLLSPDGYANADYAAELDLSLVPLSVLMLHDYSPYEYTHAPARGAAYFNEADAAISPPSATRWAIGEFGVQRWVRDADLFLRLRLQSLEEQGANSAFFHWPTGWQVYEQVENAWNPLMGSDTGNNRRMANAPLLQVLRRYWSRNSIRP